MMFPFLLVHLLVRIVAAQSSSALLPPSLLLLRFATGRIRCDPNSRRPSRWSTQSKISPTAALLPQSCTTTAPAGCLWRVQPTYDLQPNHHCVFCSSFFQHVDPLLPVPDVCLKDTMSLADSLYNLQLIKEFCEGSLQSCCPLAVEDLLYAPPLLHVSVGRMTC